MIWNKKRIKDMQVYKEKGDGFLIVFFPRTYGYLDAFCGIWEGVKPNKMSFCHSTCSYSFLDEKCYPVSQAKLRKYPEWYKFFDQYIKEV